MTKMSQLLAVLLFASASVAFAQTATQPSQPAKPTTGAGAATTVETNPAATQSGGKADKGLDTAEKNITKPKVKKSKGSKASREKGTAEKAEHAEKPEKPEHPAR